MQEDAAALVGPELQTRILDRVDAIIRECETAGKPLEMDPARSQLFELFVMADAANCLHEEADPDLSADGLCASLAERWGLKSAAQSSVKEQRAIPPEHLARMRSLWSVMRMWMEWTYAWQRWSEFHSRGADVSSGS
ncbi:hypothetical protein [Planctomicrobium sp. SH664]|uniref:hypothetical protein n=1 Tax=Planctomicrobium sp. SH664 TaxID=3448125 RepID=UPI003F5B0737